MSKIWLNCEGNRDSESTAEAGSICDQTAATAAAPRAEISKKRCIINFGTRVRVGMNILSRDLRQILRLMRHTGKW